MMDLQWWLCIILPLSAFLLALMILSREEESKRQKTVKWTIAALAAVFATVCFFRFGEPIRAVQGTLFSLVLLYAARSDVDTRIVGNFVPVEILLLSFVGCDLATVPFRIVLAAVSLLPVWVVSKIHPKQVLGGADVKIAAASIFLVGSLWGFAGYALGLLLGVVWSAVHRMTRQAFPLVPFLAVGFLTAYLL